MYLFFVDVNVKSTDTFAELQKNVICVLIFIFSLHEFFFVSQYSLLYFLLVITK